MVVGFSLKNWPKEAENTPDLSRARYPISFYHSLVFFEKIILLENEACCTKYLLFCWKSF